jgi:hypothetical protein
VLEGASTGYGWKCFEHYPRIDTVDITQRTYIRNLFTYLVIAGVDGDEDNWRDVMTSYRAEYFCHLSSNSKKGFEGTLY